jgi:AbrB family looped-hinge helix DNA binding protein
MARTPEQAEVRIDPQGRLVVPSQLRRSLGLRSGERLVARVENGRLVLERPETIIQQIREQLRAAAGDVDLVDELIADRQEEVRRESAQ